MSETTNFNPELDLNFERTSRLTPEQIWQGWTDPKTLMKWFCPRPWKVSDCRINLSIGGEFFTVMEGPGGEKMNNHGCYLDVVQKKKLVWTNLMSAGLRPKLIASADFGFVATISMAKTDQGTLYQATVAHTDAESRMKHEQMGFQEGWGMAFQQLEELFLG